MPATGCTTPDHAKSALRKAARARRDALASAAAGAALLRHFHAGPGLSLGLPAGAIFSAYIPIGSEIDPRPLIDHLTAAGLVCTLPVVVDKAAPLLFRRWLPGEPLSPGPFGTQQPNRDSPQLAPQLMLLPLLAYDAAGYRLGYGGGYYDRTLRARRAMASVTAVGLAFAGQMVETVPATPADEPLDWVVTEAGARRFRAIR